MIEVKELRFRYQTDAPEVLHGLSFAIQPGEVFGFLGPSGAGKSTTQNILIRLLKGYQGRIEVLGKPLPEWGNDLYEQVGVSFELPNHYLKLSARENLRYFAALYQANTLPVEAVLESVGLLAAADQRVANFSKGMKNRLSVARALLHQPDLLFMDEPTSGLDPVSTKRIKEL
ncbi:MAG: ABC transporter ATP-binding protein, partial [Natronospirillum sp.]